MGRRNGRIMVLLAIFELVLGAAFLYVGITVPEVGDAGYVTGVILGVTGIVMLLVGLRWLRGAATKDRISATGVAGTGQVMELRQTGLMINDQPQVELDLLVTIPGRSPYRQKVKDIVPLIMLPDARGTLPVRVDPAKPKSVVIQWDQVGLDSIMPGMPPEVAAALGAALGGAAPPSAPGAVAGPWSGTAQAWPPSGMPGTGVASGSPGPWMAAGSPQMAAPGQFGGPPGAPGSSADETLAEVAAGLAAGGSSAAPVYGQPEQAGYTVEQLRAYLRANGLAGTARIDRLEDSGRIIGDERLFTMTVTVAVPGWPSFVSGPSAAMVPLEKVGRIAVGVALPVRVAADNKDLLMFEWDRI